MPPATEPMTIPGRFGVWLTLLGTRPAAEARAAAAEIEALGYGSLWIGESTTNKDAFVNSAILLAATERIVVGTGIANLYLRDPFSMQSGALALADAYPGRFVLGVGVSHAPSVNRLGHDYGRPIATMRTYLDAMDAVNYNPPAPAQPPLRILAALRTKMMQLARERSDGAHPYLTTPRHTARAREILGDGPLLIPEQGVVIDADPQTARAAARAHLTPYMGLPNYANSWREEGFTDEDLADGGSDHFVDELIAHGDAGAVAARLAQHVDAGADHVLVQPVVPDLKRAVDELRALAPLLGLG
jgi:probable F420-dependent oxidoreductase